MKMYRAQAITCVLGFVVAASCSQPLPEAPPAETGETARLERGRYLVEAVAHCYFCHSDIDWEAAEPLPLPGKKGAGGLFPEKNLPGRIVASNITPDPETGIGAWTHEELDRAIREGIGRDGRRLFPIMPTLNELPDEDLAAIIAYLRSQPAVRNELPKTELPEPLRAGLPPPMPVARPVANADLPDPLARGKYLAWLGQCAVCHTPLNDQGAPIMELAYGGGFELNGPWGVVVASNITPDPTGISYYDEALFLKVMRTGNPGARQLNRIMPVHIYRNMTDEDLLAIFTYLKTLPPVKHRVDNTETPAPCKICGRSHGLGEG
jgi:mono/diheme cytochrome c family protein